MLTNEIGGSGSINGIGAAREALARERLEELQALARTYRSWSMKELATALGRQPGRLVPDSGMPKIDLVVALAKALDWPVEAVVDHLVKPPSIALKGVASHLMKDAPSDFKSLYNESLEKRMRRDSIEAVRLAVRAQAVADTPTRRAAALSAEASAHECAGSYTEAVRCLREATLIEGSALEWRLLCDAKLANMLFMQGQVTHAIGIASSVIEYSQGVPDSQTIRTARYIAFWARAHALRSSIPTANFEPWSQMANLVCADLRAASELTTQLCAEGLDLALNVDIGACIDVVLLEVTAVCEPDRANEVIVALIDAVREHGSVDPTIGERKAWAAVALVNTAKRFITEDLQRRGALELASAALRAHAVVTSNWYFAYRHLEIDRERRMALMGNCASSRALTAVEAKMVAGVLGHVPASRAHADEYFALYGSKDNPKEGVRP